ILPRVWHFCMLFIGKMWHFATKPPVIGSARVLLKGTGNAPSYIEEAMNQSLLLVDDDSDHLELLKSQLPGYDIDTTASPTEAIERVRAKTYAAVLTDLGMPEMSGEQLCV